MPDSKKQAIRRVEEQLHGLIRDRAPQFVEDLTVDLPKLKPDLEFEENSTQAWFPVPGMYGGFAYAWAPGSVGECLLVDSWCRVMGDSGQTHEVTSNGFKMIDDGF